MPRLLLVDDEPSILSVLSTLLKAEGYEVLPTQEGEKAVELIKNDEFDLMISDIRMSPIDGMELLKLAHDNRPTMPVIMLTAYGSVETAIEALKLGAFDYVTKPFKVDELLITVERALEYNRAETENVYLRSQLEAPYRFENIVAESPAMQKVCEMIERVAPTDATVLIYGESGTGKELVAKAIHAHSRRKDNAFIAINCAAMPEPLLESELFGHVKGAFTGAAGDKEGLFKSADGGTILLDEIGAAPLSIQGKLLRSLQEKEIRPVGSNQNISVNCRVLAATNSNLEQQIKDGTFREDLFYRLNVIPIDIKPLRERPEDILPIVYHILREELKDAKEFPSLDQEVCYILEQYPWPGNVRELENAMKHAITFSKENKISKDTLPDKIRETVQASGPMDRSAVKADSGRAKSLKSFLRAKEKEYLKQVMNTTKGNKEEAAKALKISLATLYRKLPEEE